MWSSVDSQVVSRKMTIESRPPPSNIIWDMVYMGDGRSMQYAIWNTFVRFAVNRFISYMDHYRKSYPKYSVARDTIAQKN